MTRSQSPSFEKPPVVETVIGVQFEPLLQFSNAHLGAFWDQIGGRQAWPISADVPPLTQLFERFGEDRQWGLSNTVNISIVQAPAARVQLKNQAGDRMVQLQNGRFFYNWMGAGGAGYARYRNIRAEFDNIYAEFQRFINEQELGPIRPNQWEVTYINHLPQGTVWNVPADWARLFNETAVLPAHVQGTELESFGGRWSYEIPQRRGRLHVEMQHGREATGTRELLVFGLTARGPVGEDVGAVETLGAGIDLGHDVIVNAFRDLTSADARKYWEEEEAHDGT